MHTLRSFAAVSAVVMLAVAGAGTANASPDRNHLGPAGPMVRVELFAPDGQISAVTVPDPGYATGDGPTGSTRPTAPPVPVDVIPVLNNGPSDTKFDIVFVGDGYTAADLEKYSANVQRAADKLFTIEPYLSRKSDFNIWQVNVISNESGVDGDPTRETRRDTALDSGFWCYDIERLICPNEEKVAQYASAAPDSDDQVVMFANSTKYSGAAKGNLITMAGGQSLTQLTLQHELGHTIGVLADEYLDGYPCPGPQPLRVNVSTRTAEQMTAEKADWYRYLGQPTPDGGTIGAYVGGNGCKTGIYRASTNSIMRTLGRKFNLVGLDAMNAGLDRATGKTPPVAQDTAP